MKKPTTVIAQLLQRDPSLDSSQALWYNNVLHFNVYSIPTTRLKTLGQ